MALKSSAPIAQNKNREYEEDRDVYDDGCLRIEYDNYYVACDGKRIPLSLKEFLIFSQLARKPERVVQTATLWQLVWGMSRPLDEVTLRVHICRVRHKLTPFGIAIESMPGIGYRLSVAGCCKSNHTDL